MFHFILWVSNLLFDLAIIVSIKKTVLILEWRAVMEGEYLFCLQEYRYCFASNKIWFTNISSSHPIIPNSISLSERFSILTLWSTSHFITSDQKFLVYWQDRKRCSRDLSDSPHKEHAGDGIIPILHKKVLNFVTRHLFSNLYWNSRVFVSKATRYSKL